MRTSPASRRLPSTMLALRLTAWGAAPELVELPVPRPGPGEVTLEVRAAGLCHSDLHLMDWPAGTVPFAVPFTLGHETAGVVAAIGSGVQGVHVGDSVVVYGPWGCGQCDYCARGAGNLCPARFVTGSGGLGRDGGMAGYIRVPSAHLLVPLDGLEPAQAAPLSDAALTSYHAIATVRPRLRAGARVVVIGAGGLGHVAIQILKAVTDARVLAVDTRSAAVALALRAGADEALTLPAGADPAQVAADLGTRSAEAVLDFVGVDDTIALGARLLAAGGQLVVVGAAGGGMDSVFRMLPPDGSVSLATWGTLPELEQVLGLARSGKIRLEVERFALEDAPAAYAALRDGRVVGRAVVCPAGTE